jgi:hypothetical protein
MTAWAAHPEPREFTAANAKIRALGLQTSIGIRTSLRHIMRIAAIHSGSSEARIRHVPGEARPKPSMAAGDGGALAANARAHA